MVGLTSLWNDAAMIDLAIVDVAGCTHGGGGYTFHS